ncbi:MAG: beta-galactosidase [Armatimonadota bacterium]
MNKLTIVAAISVLFASNAYALHKPAPVDEYPIHADGGLIYNPLSNEARKTGQLARYRGISAAKGKLNLGKYNLEYSVPGSATAYDVIPVKYRLSWKDNAESFPVAVEATAFEDEVRRKGRNLYDLALPGKLDLKVDYIGSITAQVKPELRNHMKPDLSDKPGTYPPFTRKPIVRSGVVESGDLVWFKFRVTNTGNTILDSQGFGGFSYVPELYMKDEKGSNQLAGTLYNGHIRELDYLYPGESREIWMIFRRTDKNPPTYGLTPGKYVIRFRAIYRWYKQFDDMVNMWQGNQMFIYEQPLTVEPVPRQTQVESGNVVLTDGGEPDKITRWIHTFEEFMTAFDCHISKPNGTDYIDGTLHLQVAPWTKHIVIKLINAGDVSIVSNAVPIKVKSESLKIKYDPDHPMNIVKNGLKEPVIFSLTMADMRTNVQHSPFPEKQIPADIKEMQKCGINVISTTAMPWLYDDMAMNQVSGYGDEHVNIQKHNGDAFKYALDTARREGMAVEGWGSYPFNRITVSEIANWITGKPFNMETTLDWGASYAQENLPEATSAMWKYQFSRWGDLYFQNASGDVPITVEDTRGMLRQDINGRWYVGQKTLTAFREWLRNKYGTLQALNSAWETNFRSFDEIDPEANQALSPYLPNWPFMRYINSSNTFHEWNQALEDFDIFRTEIRVKNYEDTLKLFRKELPEAVIDMRTEGSNVVVAGINPETSNPHFRHIYYSQRRAGVIAEVLQKSDVIRYHADFPTIPFTPTELRELVRKGVSQGIVPVYMPQFDNMRDMAINDKYGSDFQMHYNLSSPKKGVMMHVLSALYPWFASTYEEGGTPGILWQDYECDGFATETQKREMVFFKQKLSKTLNQPDIINARKANQHIPKWKSTSKTKFKKSYFQVYK